MVEELKKLAELLRAEADNAEKAKQEKSAQILNAAVGLEHLKKKIGRS